MNVRVSVNTKPAIAALERVKKALSPENVDAVVEKAALQTLAAVVIATPKKWFGQVRRSWQMQKPALGARVVRNDNKIMLFLEEGTKDHGPKEKKWLYIPLTKRAAGGWNSSLKRGVDYILKKRVKGIKARHIVAKERPKAKERLKAGMDDLVRKAVNAK